MAEPLATLDDLKGRLDWTLDADEERQAAGALEDASELARMYGLEWPIAALAPRVVRTLVLTSCARFMRNPDGYTRSDAGNESVSWSDKVGDKAGAPYFTEHEIKMLRGFNGRSGITSAPIQAWGTKAQPQGFVGTRAGTGEKPFPLFSDDLSPW